MLTAAHARFIMHGRGISRRFIDFAVDAFAFCRDDEERGPYGDLWKKHLAGTGFDDRAHEFSAVAAEILLSRSVDAFQYYLADIIRCALWRRPAIAELQQAAQQHATEYGLELDDAVREVARLHAERISNRGFKEMVKFIERTFDVTLAIDPAAKHKLRRIIAVRNMICHNHAKKNARYCKDVGEPESNIGQSVRPSLAEAQLAAEDLANFVALVDSMLIHKLDEFDA